MPALPFNQVLSAFVSSVVKLLHFLNSYGSLKQSSCNVICKIVPVFVCLLVKIVLSICFCMSRFLIFVMRPEVSTSIICYFTTRIN